MISLYFHIPFCTRKCPYCHFYVIPNQSKAQNELMKALALEWQMLLPKLHNKKIESIYFGGGTPTLLGPDNIRTILSWIEYPSTCEVTIEANPEEVTLSLMQELKQAGINRVSIGVQALDDVSLTMLGRTHNSQKAIQAIESTYQAGISNISIDLMYDLPGQTLESWTSTLAQVKSLPISHLSLYNLTIEPNTSFFKRKERLAPLLPTQEMSLKMLDIAVSSLESFGLQRYEISAFAKEKKQSHHNIGYWTARPFLGLGPSAFSYYEKTRYRNSAHLSRYSALLHAGKSPVDFSEQLAYPDDLHELLAVELRLIKGVELNNFEERHGKLPPSTQEKLQQLQKKGWLEMGKGVLRLTQEGLLFYDSVAVELV